MKKETRNFFVLLGLFFAVNLLTLTRFPSVWVDEIQFADPAIRLASGLGFTSTAWFGQNSHQFFAGNVPLYSGLLGGWLSLVGPGLVAGRIFNLILFAGILALVWRFLRLTELVTSPGWRLVVLVLLATGHAMTFSYRSGRYDVLGMLLAAICMNLWIEKRLWTLLALAGLFLPAAGLQLLPSTLLACTILVVLGGVPAVKRSAALLGGCGAGVLALKLLYGHFNAWEDFQRSTRSIGVIGQSLVQKVISLPSVYVNDKSRALIFVAIALLLVFGQRALVVGLQRRFLTGALAFAILLPVAMQMAGKFPVYYGWMIFLPLAIAFATLAGAVWQSSGAPLRHAVTSVAVVAMLVGLPLRTASVLASWQERDPQRVRAFVQGNVQPGETALADFKLYYALRTMQAPTILPTYIPELHGEESSNIDVLLLRPEDLPAARKALGDGWQPTGNQLVSPHGPAVFRSLITELREESYNVAVYRRVPVLAH